MLCLLAHTVVISQALELNISEANLAEDNLEKLIDSIEPRQYFKINVSQTAGSETNGEPAPPGSQPPAEGVTRRASKGVGLRNDSGKDSPSSVDKVSGRYQGGAKQLGGKQKASISNATLKKLLAQSVLKSPGSGGAASGLASSSKGSNFKFVFIQRATAAPKAAPNSSTSRKPLDEPTSEGKQSKLASSVSKQLASSLLYNAVSSLVSNMTSPAAPSLTSLASQLVAAAGTPSTSGPNSKPSTNIDRSTTPMVPNQAKQEVETLSSSESNDIKRVQPAATKSDIGGGYKRKSAPAGKRKQSKIYNLPVKFVSNGQPNSVVFHAIKQHFATIKKLQLATSKLHQHYHSPGSTISKLTKHHSRRPSSSKSNPSGAKPFKGANSRLIYLPLNFLSNARPSKILVGGGSRATHKSIRAES